MVISSIIGGAGEILKGVGGQPVSGITQDDVARAEQGIKSGYGKAKDIAGAGVTVAGQTARIPVPQGRKAKKKAKQEAMRDYALEQGMSQKKAESLARKVGTGKLGSKRRQALKGFLREQGGQYGLEIDPTGKVQLSSPVAGSADDTTGAQTPSDQLKDIATGANIGLAESLGGLTGTVAGDVEAGFGTRGKIRDYFEGLLPTMGEEGLTAQDQADLDAMYGAGKRRVQETLRDDLQGVMGNLTGRGFSSSSLTNQALQRGAFDPYSRNLVDLEASQAGQRQSILNQKASRRAQSIRNILGVEAGLGASNLNPITGSFVSPGAYGGFTDPAAYSAALETLGMGMGLQTGKGQALAGIRTTPYLY